MHRTFVADCVRAREPCVVWNATGFASSEGDLCSRAASFVSSAAR